MKRLAYLMFVALGITGCNKPATTDSTPKSPNNTAVNERDRDVDTKTPIDQNENQADIDVTAKIRQQVVDTKMSVNAQNVKIITQNGTVTLRGPVKSLEEKQRIEEIAKAVAGSDKVDNQLDVE
jgi:hyperosmotically inducible periplasmic protein